MAGDAVEDVRLDARVGHPGREDMQEYNHDHAVVGDSEAREAAVAKSRSPGLPVRFGVQMWFCDLKL